MKKKIAVFAVVIVAAAFACAAFAGCSTPISDEEGVQAVINAVAASKAFYEEYDAETGYSYYIKLTWKNRQEGKKETNYLAYKKGSEDLGWNEFVMAQYKNEVSDSATSDSTVEYFGDVLADNEAEDVKENYVRAYLNKDYAVAALTEEEYLAQPAVNKLTLPYVMSLFDNLDAEDISVTSATRAGAVVTVVFTVSDKSVPLAAYGEVTVRVTNEKVSALEAKQNAEDSDEDLALDYTLVYASPNVSMPRSYKDKDDKTIKIDYTVLL